MKVLPLALGLALLCCSAAIAQWQPATGPEGALIVCQAIDPLDRDSIYVAGLALFHSADGGKSWQRVDHPSDGLDEPWIRSITISRNADGPIILGTKPLTISRDRGKTWAIQPHDGKIGVLYDVQAGPAGSKVFYAWAGGAMCRSDDDAKSWEKRGELPVKPHEVLNTTADRYDADLISCMGRWYPRNGRENAVFISRDGGKTFAERPLPFNVHFAAAVSTDPDEDGVLYLCARTTGFGRSPSMFFFSFDDGASWELLWDTNEAGPPTGKTLEKLHKLFPGMLTLEPPLDRRLDLLPEEVACSEDKPGRVVAATFGRVFRSDDYGTTWTEAMTGLVGTSVSRVVFDPTDPKAAFCSDPDSVWRTADRGRTWTRMPIFEYGYVQQIAFSPDGKHAFIVNQAVRRGTRDGTDWASVRALDDVREAAGLFFTTQKADDGVPGPVIVLVGNGFFQESFDGGDTWTDPTKYSLHIHLATWDERFTTATVDGAVTWFVLDPGRGTVAASTDMGRTWAPFGPTKDLKVRVWSIAADGTIWLIDHDNTLRAVTPDGKPLESLVAMQNPDLRALVCDPADARVVYLGTKTGRVLRTTDAGATFEQLDGGPAGRLIAGLAVSPHNGALWVATGGNGVWILDKPKTHPGTRLSTTQE